MSVRYLPQCGEYALRAMAHLAQCPEQSAVSRDIAEATALPSNYLQKILAQLTRAGLLTAQRGLRGGYALTRSPESITLQDIFRAVSADVERIDHCPLGRPEHIRLCPLHRRLDEAYMLIENVFKSTTLASVCRADPGGRCDAVIRGTISPRVERGRGGRPRE